MISNADIKNAIAILRRGGAIIYPTETAYALGCDATNARAVAKVFKLKGRTQKKSLPLIASSIEMVKRGSCFEPIASNQLPHYWPGPLTVVISARGRFAPGVVAEDGTIAIRVSSHPVARALSRGLGRPIVSTSANRAGDPACYTAKDALKNLYGSPDAVLDAGRLPRRKPSTIIKIENGRVKVLRQGGIYVSQTR